MSKTDSNYDDREQSEIKHYALRLYLEAATRILGSTRNLKYIDCCAGPWKASAPDLSDTSFGIAIHTLQVAASELAKRGKLPKFACLLIEKDPIPFAELETFARRSDTSSLRVQARNWDFTERLPDIVRYCSTPGTFSFIFIDPKGWQLAGISKIRPLLQLNPGEVLINLMSSFITRFIKDNKTDFSDLLGADFPSLRELSGPELELAIVDKYCELVKREGGFDYVCSLPVMNPNVDCFNFHLIYATRHRKGVEVFKAVEKRTEEMTHIIRAQLQQKGRESKSGRLELFGPEVQYKETYYQRLARTNKMRAKEAVRALIERQMRVSYDSCWGEALRFSAVYETDLRVWISSWEQDGFISVQGKAPKVRALQVGKGISLVRNAERAPTSNPNLSP
jgi:three-Cys-motif partner protein